MQTKIIKNKTIKNHSKQKKTLKQNAKQNENIINKKKTKQMFFLTKQKHHKKIRKHKNTNYKNK